MNQKKPSRLKNLTLVGISALTGFVAIMVITVALFIGLWVDSRFGLRGPATICLLVASVPVSLYLMTRMAFGLVRQLPPPTLRDLPSSSREKEE